VKAVVLREVGGPLAVEEWPEPSGTVVDVRAAGVNFADILIRRGLYPQMPELPAVLGGEVAGELDGQRVMALTRRAGGYAERVEVDPQWLFSLPDNASFAAGAAFLTTYLTAYIPLTRQVRVSPSSTVLVHAGSGGVGSAAIQVARHFGGEVFTRSLPLLSPLGAILAIGFAGGLWVDPSVQWLVGRNAAVVGVYLGRLMKLQPQLVHECAIELLALWAQGAIDPVVGATFAFDDAGAAHALIEAREHVGKVILEPGLQR
jgi:NADPH:quinone reductase